MKWEFEKAAEKVINPSWSHGRYLDYWNVVHAINGGIIGLLLAVLVDNLYLALVIVIGLSVLYEIGEMYFGVIEDLANVIVDIFSNVVGFALFYLLLAQLIISLEIFWLSLLILLGISAYLQSRGWRSYLYRRKSRDKDHEKKY